MERRTNVGSLAIEHFNELKEAWQFEYDEHQRLDQVVVELSDNINQLEMKLAALESDLDAETIR